MVKIRLTRVGKKKAPFYHIVVADSRFATSGRIIEQIGTMDPMTDPATIKLDVEKAQDWIKKGAKPTDTVKALIEKAAPAKVEKVEKAKKEEKAVATEEKEKKTAVKKETKKVEKEEKVAKTEKVEKAEKADKAEKTEKVEKAKKAEKTEKTEKE